MYWLRYLGLAISVEQAPFVVTTGTSSSSWLSFLEQLRNRATAGYDAMFTITDVPYQEVAPGQGAAGENFYLETPTWAWASLWNWEGVAALQRGHPELGYLRDQRAAQMLGRYPNTGINGLAVVGHEMTHTALLWKGGPQLSVQIDRGPLSGLVFVDSALNPVNCRIDDTPLYKYAVQRVTTDLPYSVNMGGYDRPTWLNQFLFNMLR